MKKNKSPRANVKRKAIIKDIISSITVGAVIAVAVIGSVIIAKNTVGGVAEKKAKRKEKAGNISISATQTTENGTSTIVVSDKVIKCTTTKAKEEKTEETETAPEPWQSREKFMFTVTAYCPCEKCCGTWATNRPTDENGNEIVTTASGERAVEGVTIAVDTSVIPFGTKVEIDGNIYTAQDTGGAIKGNRIDIYFNSHEKALEFGKQEREVIIYG